MRFLRAFTILMLFIYNSFSQDTLLVEWSFDDVHPAINNLFNVIKADTNRPADRVYKLQRGGHYLLDSTIIFDFPLNLIGEKPGQTPETAPAIIQLTDEDTGSNKLIAGSQSLTLKNLWLTGSDTTGKQNNYQPIEISGSNNRHIINSCIFTLSDFALISFIGQNNNIFFTDNVFRNLIGKPSIIQWQGRGISIWTDQDSVIIENNTFFNIGMSAFQFQGGAPNFLLFVHNTIVNNGWQVVTGGWWREAYFANNLIVNGFWHGQYRENNSDQTTGLFTIEDLPYAYGPEAGRRIKIINNVAWREYVFDDLYQDSIFPQPFIGNKVKKEYLDEYEQMLAKDTLWIDPGLITVFTSEHYEKMIQNIKDLRADITPAQEYFWMLEENEDGSICHTCITWPLPEDFSYTGQSVLNAGTDGLPVGDLNWFPGDKETWLHNRDTYIYQIIWDWPAPHPIVVWQAEAEDGNIKGDAVIDTADGTLSLRLDNNDRIKWEFDLITSGKYDLNLLVNLDNRRNSQHGVNFLVNDYEIHDAAHDWGQYIFTWYKPGQIDPPLPISGFNWWRVTEAELAADEIPDAPLDLLEGQNRIELRGSWCDIYFGDIQILETGTENVVKTLTPLDATYENATTYVDSIPEPSNFRTVIFGNDGGTISWEMDIPFSFEGPGYIPPAYYSLYIYYKTTGGVQQAQIRLNNQIVVDDFILPEQSSFAELLSDPFRINSVEDTITIASQNIEIDFVGITYLYPITSLEKVNNPQKFILHQNYPNPFNPETVISYQLSMNSDVQLSVYDIMGQEVQTLVNKKQSPGNYSVSFNAQNLASGIYFYRLQAGDFIQQKKMLLIK